MIKAFKTFHHHSSHFKYLTNFNFEQAVRLSSTRSTKMSSLDHLSSQAARADLLISQIQHEIGSIKDHALSNVFKNEQNRLESENQVLRKEIEEWKHKLIQLEISHGINQVTIPSAKRGRESPTKISLSPTKAVSPAKSITTSTTPKATSPTKSVSTSDSPKTAAIPSKSEKPTKSEKKGSKDSPKPVAKAVDDEVVDVGRLDFRIGRIQAIDKHPDADALYVEQIDLAEDKPRTIVSGLVKHIKAEDLKDRLVMVLCNLKPAKMRGVSSEGMVMCASTPDKVEVLIPPQGSVPGDKVTCQGFEARPDAPFMNPKKKVFEQVAPDLKANDQGVATYKGIPLEIVGKGVVKAPSMTNCQIK